MGTEFIKKFIVDRKDRKRKAVDDFTAELLAMDNAATVTAEPATIDEPKVPNIDDAASHKLDSVAAVEDPTVIHDEQARAQSVAEEKRKIMQERIAELRKEVADERRDYLEMDHKKNTAFSRIRKYFGNKIKEKKEEGFEQDADVAYYRAHYDNKLRELQDLLVRDAKEHIKERAEKRLKEAMESGADEKKLKELNAELEREQSEELANVFTEFRFEQKITLADEHDKVKMEYLHNSDRKYDKVKDFLTKKTLGINKWYRELPIQAKLGVGVVFLGTGGALGLAGIASGTMAAGIFGGAVAAKRLFGGVMSGVGASLWLEARGQEKDREEIGKMRKEFLEMMGGMSEEEKYKFLSYKIRDIVIKDSENTIDRVKNQDIRQLAAGVLVGSLLGAGYQNVRDFFMGGGHDVMPTSPLVEHSAPAIHTETLTIGNGSNSFWGTIENKLESVEPGVDHEVATNLILHDAAKEYAISHHISVDEAINKLSKIRSGTEFSLVHDSHGWHAHFDDSHIKFEREITHTVAVPVVDHTAAAAVSPAEHIAPVSDDFSGDVDSAKIEVQSHINDLEQQREILEKEIPAKQAAWDAHRMNANGAYIPGENTGGEYWDGYDEIKNAKSGLDLTHSKIHELLIKKGVLDSPDIKTNAIGLKNFIFGSNNAGNKLFQEMKDKNIFDMWKSEESRKAFLGKFPKGTTAGLEKLIKEVPPKPGDTVRKWIIRTIIEYKKVKA